ncbi:MAG: ABC transporter ATP-binding protein [Aigarchaeota archaeon]|nr:ABC transporter ATP-binding protein [Aigarchaeota archaeon]MDW8092871.1 ABC transporter ATP-binding protein [Nitrososphaerota archaeon]
MSSLETRSGWSVIRVEGISHSYSIANSVIDALSDVSLEVSQGEFFTIIGPSGCGKSTLLNIMAGLIKPTKGTVIVAGKKVNGPQPGTISYVFQNPLLLPWRTVIDNVGLGLELSGVKKEKRREVAMEYLKLVGLSGFENMYPSELSGGMQQRVAIARALAVNPEILLMDEPFGALDEQTRLMLGEDLSRIWMHSKKTVVFVTHSLAEAAFLSTRVAVMSARPGRIIDVVDIDVERPRDPESEGVQKVRRELWLKLKRGIGK